MLKCECCGEECTASVIDEGIGTYEYWGSRGVDICLVVESDCCGEPVLNDDNEYVTVEELKELNFDGY
jgi:hypothetical protein